MKKLDTFIKFFVDNRDDERIEIYKRMKFGHRFYHITFSVDDDPNNNKSQNKISHYLHFRDHVEIVFDNRNNCIEIVGSESENIIIVEDEVMVKKWSNILEEILQDGIEDRICDLFEKSLNQCHNKNLYRDLRMKKIFKEEDESL